MHSVHTTQPHSTEYLILLPLPSSQLPSGTLSVSQCSRSSAANVCTFTECLLHKRTVYKKTEEATKREPRKEHAKMRQNNLIAVSSFHRCASVSISYVVMAPRCFRFAMLRYIFTRPLVLPSRFFFFFFGCDKRRCRCCLCGDCKRILTIIMFAGTR